MSGLGCLVVFCSAEMWIIFVYSLRAGRAAQSSCLPFLDYFVHNFVTNN